MWSLDFSFTKFETSCIRVRFMESSGVLGLVQPSLNLAGAMLLLGEDVVLLTAWAHTAGEKCDTWSRRQEWDEARRSRWGSRPGTLPIFSSHQAGFPWNLKQVDISWPRFSTVRAVEARLVGVPRRGFDSRNLSLGNNGFFTCNALNTILLKERLIGPVKVGRRLLKEKVQSNSGVKDHRPCQWRINEASPHGNQQQTCRQHYWYDY